MKKILMASVVLSVFAISIVVLEISSCKKVNAQKDCPVPTYQVAGLWIGTYTVTSMPAQSSLFYSFIIYPDGTIVTNGKGNTGQLYYSSGNWQLSNSNVFSATITSFVTPYFVNPITQTITGTYSNNGTISNATWADVNNPTGTNLSGSFSTLQRVN